MRQNWSAREKFVSVAVRPWLPSAKAAVVHFHAPLPSAGAVPICFIPSGNSTVLFASGVPVRVSVLALVMWSPILPVSGENELIVGALVAGKPMTGSSG